MHVEPTAEQEHAIGLFASGVNLAVEAGAGCLVGSTSIRVNRAGKGSAMRLDHVVAQMSGSLVLGRKWDPAIPTRVASAFGGVIRLAPLAAAWCSGEQEVFDLVTTDGRRLRGTSQHPVLTPHGWAGLGSLDAGSTVLVNAGRSTRGRRRARHYRQRDTRHHPHQVRRSVPRDRWAVPEHRLVIEAAMNGMSLAEYLDALRGVLPVAGLRFLPADVHVHHRNGDPLDNSLTNLSVLDVVDHHRTHAADGGADHVLWQVGTATVATVEPAGVEMTYDLEIAGDPHNFVADGFVVHNTGKTSTLELIARTTQRPGAYVAFNRAIVNEAAERMPMNVVSSTAHSLAFRAVGAQYRGRLDAGRVPSWKLAKMLHVDPLLVVNDGARKVLQPSYLASLVMRGIVTFCTTADPAPAGRHLPRIHGIDAQGEWANNDLVRAELAPALTRAWADLLDPAGGLPFKHDHYLKAWQLADPLIPGDFILFDEAQDASPVMLDAVERQAERGAQLVFVGDSQQQVYEWRGAVNALDRVAATERAMLTQSWRFGPAVAEVANLVLAELGADLRLVGCPGIASVVDYAARPDAILCRSNAAAVETVLRLQADGKHPHLVGGGDDVLRFAKAARDLMEKGETWHPDLACFTSWPEVVSYVADDPQGDELALLVGLVVQYGVETILLALDGMVAEREADLVISTAHKAKGREWDAVRIGGDFRDPGDDAGEWRLLYVAATRAKLRLDLGACEPLRALVAAGRPA